MPACSPDFGEWSEHDIALRLVLLPLSMWPLEDVPRHELVQRVGGWLPNKTRHTDNRWLPDNTVKTALAEVHVVVSAMEKVAFLRNLAATKLQDKLQEVVWV